MAKVVPSMAYNEDLIIAAYRIILGREPDNNQTVREKALRFTSPEQVLRDFMQSTEFKANNPSFIEVLAHGYTQQHLRIQTDVTPEQLNNLFERIRKQWTRLGETEPYWSVISIERFKTAVFPDNKNDFYDSGQKTDSLIEVFFQRANCDIPSGCCLEFGCGVGRVTRFLAKRFDKVIAVDLSPGNLRLCRQFLQDAGLKNVEYILLEKLSDLDQFPGFDLLFSTIVLQHNPPPVIKLLLEKLFGKINNNGFALFQVPTHTDHYTFDVQKYLESSILDNEMHCIPMSIIFDLLARNSLYPKEVIMDTWTRAYGSHTFFAQKAEHK
jgi:SAM-dependent methyltransferase